MKLLSLLRSFAVAAAALALTTGCHNATYPTTGIALLTDTSAFVLQSPRSNIPVTVTNQSSATVSIATCANVVILWLERRDGRQWSGQQHYACANIPYEAHALDPGQSVTGWVHPEILGMHRVRAGIITSSGDLRFSRETSPLFEIR